MAIQGLTLARRKCRYLIHAAEISTSAIKADRVEMISRNSRRRLMVVLLLNMAWMQLCY
jgi:hypothetical protein